MRVRVDETGRDDEPVGVDRLRRFVVDLADLDDAAVTDADVGLARGRTGAVDDRPPRMTLSSITISSARLALRFVHRFAALRLGRDARLAGRDLGRALGFLRGPALLALGLELLLVERRVRRRAASSGFASTATGGPITKRSSVSSSSRMTGRQTASLAA